MKWLLFILTSSPLIALETSPWFGPLFQPEIRTSFLYQFAPKLSTGMGDIPVSEKRETGFGSFMISPWFNWSAEIELAITHTRLRNVTFFDFGRLTARYLWFNDVEGDPLSLATGASLTLPSDTSLREPTTYQLDLPTLVLHTSIGKEIPFDLTWKWHLWAFGALHIPFNGSPHLEGTLYVERNMANCHVIRFFVDGHLGLGSRNLNLANFHGYGPLQTRRVFLGLRYTLRAFVNGSLYVQYDYTPYARNAPLEVQRLYVGLFYPL